MRILRNLSVDITFLFGVTLLPALVLAATSRDLSECRHLSSDPDGICYPVVGTGHIVTCKDGARVPIGTLSALIAGDSLIVEDGTITFVDFRTDQSRALTAGTRMVIPHVPPSKGPSRWRYLINYILHGMKDTERNRIGGSVRDAGRRVFWPDSERFAPEIPIVFEWSGVCPPPALLRIYTGRDTTETALSEQSPRLHVLAWPRPMPPQSGTIEWELFDADGESLGGGRFVILTAETADAERKHFHDAANGIQGEGEVEFKAAVLARADRAYLW